MVSKRKPQPEYRKPKQLNNRKNGKLKNGKGRRFLDLDLSRMTYVQWKQNTVLAVAAKQVEVELVPCWSVEVSKRRYFITAADTALRQLCH